MKRSKRNECAEGKWVGKQVAGKEKRERADTHGDQQAERRQVEGERSEGRKAEK